MKCRKCAIDMQKIVLTSCDMDIIKCPQCFTEKQVPKIINIVYNLEENPWADDSLTGKLTKYQ